MTVTWFDGCQLTLECAFASAPGAAAPTWTDITTYVRGTVTTSIGRASEFDEFQSGQLTVTLANADRRFDPNYTAGPYYPNVLPNKRIRLRAIYNTVTYDLFTGWVDGWPQVYDDGANTDATVTLVAHDLLKVMAKAQLPESPWAVEVKADNPAIWYRFDEGSGTTMIDQSGNGRDAVYRGGGTFYSRTGLLTSSSDQAIGFPEGAGFVSTTYGEGIPISIPTLTTAPPFTAEVWMQSGPTTTGASNGETYHATRFQAGWFYRDFDTASADRVTVLLPTAGAFVTPAVAPGNNVPIYASASASGVFGVGTISVTLNGTVYAVGAYGGTITTSPAPEFGYAVSSSGAAGGMTVDEFVIYTTALSTARIAAHYAAGSTAWAGDLSGARANRILDAIGWNATDRSVDAGRTTCQAADYRNQTALSYLQLLARSEQGQVYANPSGALVFEGRDRRLTATASVTSQATYSDQAAASIRYSDLQYDYSDARIYNVVQTQRSNGSTFTATDATSVTNYGYQQDPSGLTGLVNQSDQEIRDVGAWRLGKYKSPIQRITGLRLTPRSAPTTVFPEVLGRKISDRVTVARTPQAVGSAISTAVIVEGIQHRIDVAGTWETTMLLSPADTVQWLVLDNATLGQLDSNALAF